MSETNRQQAGEPILEVEDAVSYYGKVEVTSHVSIKILRGESVGMLGRNGAGKSTLMRTIMNLAPPVRRQGRIRFLGQDITGWSTYRIGRLGLGYAPDDRKIFPHLSVLENLEIAHRLAPAERKPRSVEEILSLFPLVDALKERGGGGLSGGEQKLVAIARAMIQNPELIMLDETSEGLSPVMVQQLVGVLNTLRREGVTLVIADQNLRFCAKVASRGYMLERGRIVLEGTIDELWHKLAGDEMKLMV